MTDPGRQKYSESTLRLAERYGIDPARLDAMLGSPGSAPSATPGVDQHMHQPNAVPPVQPTPPPVYPVKPVEPIRVQDPNIRPASASGNYVPPPKDIRAQGSTLSSPPR
ncbi:MAG TPA: hypothetical protein VFH43_13215 [Candidatus Kapabacteria bacterium]|nr:hypothetical protein [Candidatus Kapabacteria bacterium]